MENLLIATLMAFLPKAWEWHKRRRQRETFWKYYKRLLESGKPIISGT